MEPVEAMSAPALPQRGSRADTVSTGPSVEGRIEPGRLADRARSQPQAPERERIAQDPGQPPR
jgi:hypothetical protein